MFLVFSLERAELINIFLKYLIKDIKFSNINYSNKKLIYTKIRQAVELNYTRYGFQCSILNCRLFASLNILENSQIFYLYNLT